MDVNGNGLQTPGFGEGDQNPKPFEGGHTPIEPSGPESAGPVNRLGKYGGMTRQQRRQLDRENERRVKAEAFATNQKVTRYEYDQLLKAFLALRQDMNDYASFVRNVFFVLESRCLVSLDEMDGVARKKQQEVRDFEEIHKREDIPMSEKLALAKEKGLSQVFLDILAQPAQPVKLPEVDEAKKGQ